MHPRFVCDPWGLLSGGGSLTGGWDLCSDNQHMSPFINEPLTWPFPPIVLSAFGSKPPHDHFSLPTLTSRNAMLPLPKYILANAVPLQTLTSACWTPTRTPTPQLPPEDILRKQLLPNGRHSCLSLSSFPSPACIITDLLFHLKHSTLLKQIKAI